VEAEVRQRPRGSARSEVEKKFPTIARASAESPHPHEAPSSPAAGLLLCVDHARPKQKDRLAAALPASKPVDDQAATDAALRDVR